MWVESCPPKDAETLVPTTCGCDPLRACTRPCGAELPGWALAETTERCRRACRKAWGVKARPARLLQARRHHASPASVRRERTAGGTGPHSQSQPPHLHWASWPPEWGTIRPCWLSHPGPWSFLGCPCKPKPVAFPTQCLSRCQAAPL